MAEYNFFADLLNKYSQLTPWVQALVGLFLRSIIHRIELSNVQVKIELCANHLIKALQGVLLGETSS